LAQFRADSLIEVLHKAQELLEHAVNVATEELGPAE